VGQAPCLRPALSRPDPQEEGQQPERLPRGSCTVRESATIQKMDPKAIRHPRRPSDSPDFYDLIAPIYDRHWGRAFFSSAARLFRHYAAPRIPARGRVLDLCCGSGRFASFLSRAGYRVTGVDSSPALLEKAAARTPSARFVQADMCRFQLADTFDAAVCWFNSLNHAEDEQQLAAIFACVARHLAPAAPFLFDLIPEEDYRCSWESEECVLAAEGVYELTYSYWPEDKVASCRARMRSRLDPARIQAEAVSVQRPLDLEAVARALHDAGFRLLLEKPLDGSHPPHGRHLVLAEHDRPSH